MKNKTRVVCIAIIVFSLVFAVTDYFSAMRVSYNKYLDGEYYFCYKATTQAHDSDTWWATAEAQNLDYSDPKTMLLHSSGSTYYVYGPHDRVCSLIYRKDNVLENFPLSNLVIAEEDKEYFYGTKKYTYKEYIDKLNALTDDQIKSDMLSDPAMRNYKKVRDFMFILICVDAFGAFLIFLLNRGELYDSVNLVLIIGALYSIFFEVMTFFAYGRLW